MGQDKARKGGSTPNRAGNTPHFTPAALLLRPGRAGAAVAGIFALLVRRLEDLEGAHEALVHAHHRTSVVKLAYVLGEGGRSDAGKEGGISTNA